MTERLRIDEVRIQAGGEVVVISWEERQELLERLRKVDGTAGLVGRFEAVVGTSVPVALEPGDVDVLAGVLLSWQEGGGSPAPDGIRSLAAMMWRALGGSLEAGREISA